MGNPVVHSEIGGVLRPAGSVFGVYHRVAS
jgi:hypothetical protein